MLKVKEGIDLEKYGFIPTNEWGYRFKKSINGTKNEIKVYFDNEICIKLNEEYLGIERHDLDIFYEMITDGVIERV